MASTTLPRRALSRIDCEQLSVEAVQALGEQYACDPGAYMRWGVTPDYQVLFATLFSPKARIGERVTWAELCRDHLSLVRQAMPVALQERLGQATSVASNEKAEIEPPVPDPSLEDTLTDWPLMEPDTAIYPLTPEDAAHLATFGPAPAAARPAAIPSPEPVIADADAFTRGQQLGNPLIRKIKKRQMDSPMDIRKPAFAASLAIFTVTQLAQGFSPLMAAANTLVAAGTTRAADYVMTIHSGKKEQAAYALAEGSTDDQLRYDDAHSLGPDATAGFEKGLRGACRIAADREAKSQLGPEERLKLACYQLRYKRGFPASMGITPQVALAARDVFTSQGLEMPVSLQVYLNHEIRVHGRSEQIFEARLSPLREHRPLGSQPSLASTNDSYAYEGPAETGVEGPGGPAFA